MVKFCLQNQLLVCGLLFFLELHVRQLVYQEYTRFSLIVVNRGFFMVYKLQKPLAVCKFLCVTYEAYLCFLNLSKNCGDSISPVMDFFLLESIGEISSFGKKMEVL